MAVVPPPIDFPPARDYRDEIGAPADRIRLLRVPLRRYLMIDGTDAPGGAGFRDAIGSLYPVAYTLHFLLKRRSVDARVGGLEGLFWAAEPGPIAPETLQAAGGGGVPWNWRLLLPVPDEATDAEVVQAFAEAGHKKQRPSLLDGVRCEAWEEGPVAQILHVGPYDAEPPTIERLHREIAEHGLRARGCHHEIYISDPGRTKPERLKTVIRQPVEPS